MPTFNNDTRFRGCAPDSTQQAASVKWNAEGEVLFSGGNTEEAKRCFEKAVEFDPGSTKALNNLSVAHWTLGDHESSLCFLTRALETDPNDRDVILNCSKVFEELGKRRDALDVLRAYLQRKPWDDEVRREMLRLEESLAKAPSPGPADLFNEEGEKRFEQGKIEHARACFEIAAELDPRHARARNNLGVLHWREGDLQGALERFYSALELDSEDSDILFNSTRALCAAGHPETAGELLKVYLQKNPGDERAWADYAAMLRDGNNRHWDPRDLSPDLSEVYLSMGKKLALSKDWIGASEAFSRSLSLNPGKADAYYALGCIHRELDQSDQALEMFAEALALDAFHKPSVLASGEIFLSLGKPEEASRMYESFLKERKDRDVQQALKKIGDAGAP
ncbi:MAG TPA: tetratricopeptide repeat protein [Syntrophobacteraceae bacterium]|nr:tetratricopeptide repeat protein [Syntrophobacteraceae bacterium]